ncbi:MAG: class I SAM-dependent methyltransferase [Bacteriovoracia bacterium]
MQALIQQHRKQFPCDSIAGFTLIDWHCPTCGPTSQEKVLGYRSTGQERNVLTTRLVQCTNCTLIYANPFPVANYPAGLYENPESYFAGHESAQKITANREILKKMKTLIGATPRVLDVGSGCGELLVAALQENIEAVGIEISDGMVTAAAARHSVSVFKQTVEESAEAWPSAFNGIVLNAVLEHAYDPDRMIASAKKLLLPGGILYIDVPNEPNILTRAAHVVNRLVGGNKTFCLSPTWEPYHVYGFNPRALEALLTKHGFRVEELSVFASCGMAAQSGLKRKAQAWLANHLNTIGNLTGTSGNLSLWARLEK